LQLAQANCEFGMFSAKLLASFKLPD